MYVHYSTSFIIDTSADEEDPIIIISTESGNHHKSIALFNIILQLFMCVVQVDNALPLELAGDNSPQGGKTQDFTIFY